MALMRCDDTAVLQTLLAVAHGDVAKVLEASAAKQWWVCVQSERVLACLALEIHEQCVFFDAIHILPHASMSPNSVLALVLEQLEAMALQHDCHTLQSLPQWILSAPLAVYEKAAYQVVSRKVRVGEGGHHTQQVVLRKKLS